MSEFKVYVQNLTETLNSVEPVESILQQTISEVSAVKRNLRVQIRQRQRIDSRLSTTARQLEAQRQSVVRMVKGGRQVVDLYQQTENQLLNTVANGGATQGNRSAETGFLGWLRSFIEQIKKWFAPKPVTYMEIESVVFDDDGTYGGNQGSPQGRTGAEKKALYNIVRTYYPDFTDREINQYMKKINSEGCGYVAVINTIFAAFEGREKAFEEKFGFPMYGKNGDLNYDRLLVDYYAATDNHNQGKTGDYINYREDASKEELKKSSYNYRTDATGRGTSQYDREYRTHLYLDKKGVPLTVENDYKLTPQTFAEASKDGYVIISYRYGNLQREDGSVYQYIDGGHAMVVTGVTDDGRYVVSSWGERFYIDPKEIVQKGDNSTSFTFARYQYN